MSRVEKNENKTLVSAPVSPAALLPTTPEAMDNGIIAPSTSKFLPFMEMVFPVMATPAKPWYRGKDYRVGFLNGNIFEAFPEGTLLTVFDKRNAARKGAHDDPDKVYAYSAVERAGQIFGATHETFQDLLAESKTNKSVLVGYSFVVGALYPGGKAVILDFSAFKTIAPYFYGPLSPALFAKKTALKINIEDHSVNLTEAKSGNFYPDSKKFRQWEEVALTAPQMNSLMEAFKASEEGYMTWLNK